MEATLAGMTGLEPATFRVTGGRSNQLSYSPPLSSLAPAVISFDVGAFRAPAHLREGQTARTEGARPHQRTLDPGLLATQHVVGRSANRYERLTSSFVISRASSPSSTCE